jgi:hypothetical protein
LNGYLAAGASPRPTNQLKNGANLQLLLKKYLTISGKITQTREFPGSFFIGVKENIKNRL